MEMVNWQSTCSVVRVAICAFVWEILRGLTYIIVALHEVVVSIGAHWDNSSSKRLVKINASLTKSDGGSSDANGDRDSFNDGLSFSKHTTSDQTLIYKIHMQYRRSSFLGYHIYFQWYSKECQGCPFNVFWLQCVRFCVFASAPFKVVRGSALFCKEGCSSLGRRQLCVVFKLFLTFFHRWSSLAFEMSCHFSSSRKFFQTI